MSKSIAPERIASAILVMRGHRVLLDAELAAVSARRVGHYRMDADGKIGLHHFLSSDYAAKRLQLMTEKGTEQEVILAEILNAKWSSSPPSDYIDRI